jgi:ABC-type nitrate/sulfonate/bicarbonate transport system permease component
MSTDALKRILPTLLIGFAIGVAVGVTLEASGTLERLDAAIAQRIAIRPHVVEEPDEPSAQGK